MQETAPSSYGSSWDAARASYGIFLGCLVTKKHRQTLNTTAVPVPDCRIVGLRYYRSLSTENVTPGAEAVNQTQITGEYTADRSRHVRARYRMT